MKDQIKAFVRLGRHIVLREQVELLFGYRKWMRARCITGAQPIQTQRIIGLQDMQPMGCSGVIDDPAHPQSYLWRICRKVENDRHPCPQQITDMRPHRRT
jgi:hypothetical protein